MRRAQQVNKIPLEVITEVVDELLWVLADNLEVPDMTLALYVAFKSVGVATLLLAGLTPPAQALQPLRLHLIRNPFCTSGFRFAHGLCMYMCRCRCVRCAYGLVVNARKVFCV